MTNDLFDLTKNNKGHWFDWVVLAFFAWLIVISAVSVVWAIARPL